MQPDHKDIVLILTDDYDVTTTTVCKWLKNLNQKFVRINRYDELEIEEITLDGQLPQVSFRHLGKIINITELKSYWFRRGELTFKELKLTESQKEKANFEFEMAIKQVTDDNSVIKEYIHHLLNSQTKSLCDYYKRHNNKLIHLKLANEVGLQTPPTYIITKKSRLIELMKKYPQGLITKVVSNTGRFDIKKDDQKTYYYSLYTNKIDPKDLEAMPNEFPISQVQPLIEKAFEVRSFYMDGSFYSMAIFSQQDKQTQIDFRRYNYYRPNRTVPFKLPETIEKKLKIFMDTIGLNTGSFDMIYGLDKKFYFLEVNPVGQFGMVSRPCNYYLEKKVAEYLKNA